MDAKTPATFNQLAGRRLRAARKYHQLTQQACADICNIDISTWSKWEKGSNPIDPELIAKFVKTHSLTLDWLFYGRNVRLSAELIKTLDSHFAR